MDLETFFSELYVRIDDWYKAHWERQLRRETGAKGQMSDSAVLTVLVAGQWQVGVARRSERGLLRWLAAYGRGWFPRLLKRSAFNERVHKLWSVCLALQQAVAEGLGSRTAAYECVDGLPIPAYTCGQACREDTHWLWESKRGHGGTGGGWFIGKRLLASVSPDGVLTGWLLATANVHERCVLHAFLSARAGSPNLNAPPLSSHERQSNDLTPPVQRIGPFQAVGHFAQHPYLADHWQTTSHATVLAPPSPHASHPWSVPVRRAHASARQIIETVFAVLSDVFAIKRVNAHSCAGLYARLAAKTAAFNLGILLNRALGRPDLAHLTLLC